MVLFFHLSTWLIYAIIIKNQNNNFEGGKMKVLCQGTELSDALAKVTKALPFKRSNPILDGVKLTAAGDTLTLFATDTELAIEKKSTQKFSSKANA